MENVELVFNEDALHEIAKRALKRKAGARGLRTVVEKTLLDTMYNLPSLSNVAEVIVDAAAIQGIAEPKVVYNYQEQGHFKKIAK
jgi:ATP-dependent Clp protease ATP-binding subunit ClpX